GVDVKLLNLLRAAPLGLTLKELHRGTSNKHKGSELRDALARMAVAGTAVSRSEKSETARRAVDRWFALIPAQA
ncbi:hypothetical protein, partial [Mycoplasmopsis arginini]|uniref:hypothetical protein n=1 Tax=Mycoplasmopsis arginini TaxID=2094 RepID=UPI00249F329D